MTVIGEIAGGIFGMLIMAVLFIGPVAATAYEFVLFVLTAGYRKGGENIEEAAGHSGEGLTDSTTIDMNVGDNNPASKFGSWYAKHVAAVIIMDIIIMLLAVLLELLYLTFFDVQFGSDWTTQLYNNQCHAPIYTGSLPTVAVIFAAAFTGFIVLSLNFCVTSDFPKSALAMFL